MKIQNLLLLLLFLLSSVACKKEHDETPASVSGTHISIDDLVALLSPALKKPNLALYKNAAGEEKWIKTAFGEIIQTRNEYGENYTHSSFTVAYVDEEEPGTSMGSDGLGLYKADKTVSKTIGAIRLRLASQSESSGFSGVYFSVENGRPIVTQFDHFHETFEVNGKTFKDVYQGYRSIDVFNHDSEINLNLSEGIVAFQDENNVMWVFERFGD